MSYCQSMNQAQVSQAEREIERQKSSHFRGRARVPLEFLHFPEHSPRDLDQGNLQRLMDVYGDEGVKRLKHEHYVPAVIGKEDLLGAIQISGLSLVGLLNGSHSEPPLLTFPEGFRLECLHGKHRIEAAKRSGRLRGEDRWWIVTLYSEGLSKEARRSLVEDYSSSRAFTDGMIFRKIIEYESSDKYSRQHWWSWLTDCKKDILTRIFKHAEYNSALRKLMKIPALLEDFQITIWHRILATHSDEEFLHYIRYIIVIFDHICGSEQRLRIALDKQTVALLQCRCPRISVHDRNYLRRLMHEKKIFPTVDDGTRQEIWKRLCQIRHLIPTLGSLQHDFKYIEGPAKAINKLLLKPAKRRGQGRMTLRDSAQLAFAMPRGSRNVIIQITDDSTQEIAADEKDQFEIGFQQLYLFAMRESRNLVGDRPLKEREKKTPSARSPDPITWHDFAQLAHVLGFESPEVQRLRQINPFEEKARQKFLEEETWTFVKALPQDLLTYTANLYRAKSRVPTYPSHESQMLTEDSGEPVERRRGRCYEDAYERDKQHMFIKTLSRSINGHANSITSLFVRKCVYQAFFPSCEVESKTPTVPGPNEGINSTMAEQQENDDTDMRDAATASYSSPKRDDFDPFHCPNAGSSNFLPAGSLSANKTVENNLLPMTNPASTTGTSKSLERSHSVTFGPPANVLSPEPSVVLRLVDVDSNGQSWPKKRPCSTDDLEGIESQSSIASLDGGENQTVTRRRSDECVPSASALIPKPPLTLQLLGGDSDDPFWARKRPRIDSDPQAIEGQSGHERASGGENQTMTEFMDTSFTPEKSTQRDAHPETSNQKQVSIWTNPDGNQWVERKDLMCNSIEEVKAAIEKLGGENICNPSDKEGRYVAISECYDLATKPGGDFRVYLKLLDDL